jgi:hypothetical protein
VTQRREASIPHFLRKRNYALSHLPTERERRIKKTKKKKNLMWHICFFFYLFLVNWSYFTMGLLYCIKMGKFFGLILKKKKLGLKFKKNKKLGLIKFFFWALLKKSLNLIYWVLGDGLNGIAIGPALYIAT